VKNARAHARQRILIAEANAPSGQHLEQALRQAGYEEVLAVAEPELVLPAFTGQRPDLVLLGLGAHHPAGLEVLRQIRARVRRTEFLPVAVLIDDAQAAVKERLLDAQVDDVFVRPLDSADLVLRVRSLLQLRRAHAQLHGSVRATKARLRRAWIEMSERLALMAEFRMSVDGTAPARIGVLAAHIADRMGLLPAEVRLIRYAAPLHDVGMIGLPQILANNGLLSLEELDALKTHTTAGAALLAGSKSPIMRLAEDIALFHHEHWDGSGYTMGLSGEAIPLVARIVAVADTFDAMTRDRSYQAARPADEAAEWIEAQSGRKFDPAVVEAFQHVRVTSELPLL
jgi:putative two-component system response regulator